MSAIGTTESRILIHSYKSTCTLTRISTCIDCGKTFTQDVDVYTDAELELENGHRKHCPKVSFSKSRRCPDCDKIPKSGFLYDLAGMFRKQDEHNPSS